MSRRCPRATSAPSRSSTHTVTGDTLGAKDHPLALPAIEFPRPPYNAAVTPRGKADVDKLGPSLQRIAEEDPTLVVHREETTGETIMSGMGETHVEVAAERMKRKFGVEVDLHPPRVPYRETVTGKVDSEYIHKKQTGGHGQYARVSIKVEPNKGGGFQFVDAVVGGSVPRNYIPAVEKGVHEALNEGALAHFPMVDIKVTLFDGKDHPVDSSEMAFKLAGSQALKQGALKANPVLLEPIVSMKIRVPDSNTGDVMSDLNGKRAKVHGMSPEDGGTTVIDAEAPLAEVLRYATDLRSITQGRGTLRDAVQPLRRGAPTHRAEGDRGGHQGPRGRARVAVSGQRSAVSSAVSGQRSARLTAEQLSDPSSHLGEVGDLPLAVDLFPLGHHRAGAGVRLDDEVHGVLPVLLALLLRADIADVRRRRAAAHRHRLAHRFRRQARHERGDVHHLDRGDVLLYRFVNGRHTSSYAGASSLTIFQTPSTWRTVSRIEAFASPSPVYVTSKT